jgi:hypothetical protein
MLQQRNFADTVRAIYVTYYTSSMGFNVKNLKSALEGGTSKNGGIEI